MMVRSAWIHGSSEMRVRIEAWRRRSIWTALALATAPRELRYVCPIWFR